MIRNVGYIIVYTFALCGLAADAVSTYCIERGTEPTLLIPSDSSFYLTAIVESTE